MLIGKLIDIELIDEEWDTPADLQRCSKGQSVFEIASTGGYWQIIEPLCRIEVQAISTENS